MMGMSKIVKTMVSIALPLTLIYGLYIIAHGHITPGGGFQGGAVVASGLAMLVVAYGSVWTMDKIKRKHLSLEQILESVGAIAFIGLAFLGLIFGSIFFNNFMVGNDFLFGEIGRGLSNISTAGIIPLMNFAVGLKVIAGLFGIVILMAYATSKKGGIFQ
jgi:multicomponent Na+:H+ antiporter subunit B